MTLAGVALLLLFGANIVRGWAGEGQPAAGPTNEQGTRLAMRMISGDAFVLVFNEGRRPDSTTELRVQPVAADALARAAASDAIVLREEKDTWMRETRLSTKGLSEALSGVPSRCGGRT